MSNEYLDWKKDKEEDLIYALKLAVEELDRDLLEYGEVIEEIKELTDYIIDWEGKDEG